MNLVRGLSILSLLCLPNAFAAPADPVCETLIACEPGKIMDPETCSCISACPKDDTPVCNFVKACDPGTVPDFQSCSCVPALDCRLVKFSNPADYENCCKNNPSSCGLTTCTDSPSTMKGAACPKDSFFNPKTCHCELSNCAIVSKISCPKGTVYNPVDCSCVIPNCDKEAGRKCPKGFKYNKETCVCEIKPHK